MVLLRERKLEGDGGCLGWVGVVVVGWGVGGRGLAGEEKRRKKKKKRKKGWSFVIVQGGLFTESKILEDCLQKAKQETKEWQNVAREKEQIAIGLNNMIEQLKSNLYSSTPQITSHEIVHEIADNDAESVCDFEPLKCKIKNRGGERKWWVEVAGKGSRRRRRWWVADCWVWGGGVGVGGHWSGKKKGGRKRRGEGTDEEGRRKKKKKEKEKEKRKIKEKNIFFVPRHHSVTKVNGVRKWHIFVTKV